MLATKQTLGQGHLQELGTGHWALPLALAPWESEELQQHSQLCLLPEILLLGLFSMELMK